MDGVAVRLAKLKREAEKEWRKKWRQKLRKAAPANAAEWRALGGAAVGALLQVLLIIALPFLVLVRGSVFFYENGTRSVWLAMLTAGILTGGVITAYAVWIAKKLMRRGVRGGRALVIPVAKWVALPLVVFYCGYSLLYLASVNAKSEPVRAYYRSVHPLLRLALSTAILADHDILITDAGRVPEDYGKMGLPANSRTRHFKQKDGYVHAVDLRTTHRGVIKNRGLQFYFWLMGFDTRRHVGTADHLHVELN
ncbi:MAG TPA: hypothetical protein VMR92_14370 [Gemmatimonadales bacterium]|jgi:hypothetical protein|nr:hypothetical protein [Gemmatimonadales bacterium]